VTPSEFCENVWCW